MLRSACFAGSVLLPVLWPVNASAESLFDAMASAYSGNPTLRADRARQRATDEQVPQALSGWRPTIRSQADFGYQWSDTDVSPSNENGPVGVSISLSQPIFRGFKTVQETAAAEANVEAGRQALLATEQNVLFQAVQAYANVIRDRQIVSLRQRNVGVLRQQLDATNERFNVGEVTRTDVAQSRASLAQSQSDLAGAKAQLAASIASYVKVIGRSPGKLTYPKIVKLPRSLDAALTDARRINPNILQAAFVEDAAVHTVEVVRGDMLPEIRLEAGASVQNDPSEAVEFSESAQIQGVISVPIYQGGRISSRVREAKQTASQRRIQVIETERAVREGVTASWNNFIEAGQRIKATKARVSAAALALDGVRQEYIVGSRTTQDVLDAEQDVLEARIIQVAAERDRVVFGYQLIGSVGRLTARELGLRVHYYDPEENYLEVRDKLFGVKANTVE
jgi:TolC family type I secretion outer membrane protein